MSSETDQDDAAVDQLMRAHFGVEPVDDPSGLLGAPTSPPGEPDEDERFAAYMRLHFPGSVG